MILLSTLPRPDPAWFIRPDGHDASRHVHGVKHTLRVMIHAVEIAEAEGASSAERKAVLLAALWHDIGRTCDARDYHHGAKSAGKVVGLGLHREYPSAIVEVALFAITHHPCPDERGERAAMELPDPAGARRVFQILKDADGLDRVRLGDLDVSLLRFETSRLREPRAQELLKRV